MAIIDKPSDYFNTVLYTGNATGRTITGVGFQPDWVWGKVRSEAQDHVLVDSIRGATKQLYSSDTAAEQTEAQGLTGFDSDGFTLGTHAYFNGNSKTYVAWNWKAGTSFTNDASATGIGSIDSTGSVNTDAGFSVISYTGNGSGGATVAHGLGSVPHMYIIKRRDTGSSNWHVYHQGIGATKGLRLNLTNAENTTDIWQDTAPTSSVFSLGESIDVNASGGSFIGYIFSEKQGYSKFGSYVGNGSNDGVFCFTGMKPSFVLVKRTDSTANWSLIDNTRDPFNVTYHFLEPNVSDAEFTPSGPQAAFDFCSQGFKCRSTNGAINASGGSYIYACFAENPFTTSTGVPATAR
jgi:hypothetical protein